MSILIELGAIVLVSYLADKWLSVKGKEEGKELEKVKEDQNSEKTTDQMTPYDLKLIQIKKQEGEINTLKHEAEQYNSTDSYVKYSKIQRTILKLSKELENSQAELKDLKEANSSNKSESSSSSTAETPKDDKQSPSRFGKIKKLFGKDKLAFILPRLILIITFKFFPITMNADLQAVWPLSAIVGTQTSPLVAILNPAIQVNITLKVIVTIKEFIETMGSQKKTSLTDSKKQD